MAFATIPINITGGTHQSRSRPLSTQITVNLYPQLNQAEKEPFTLHSFPGQKLISGIADAEDRNGHVMNEEQYNVVGNTLYKIDRLGAHEVKGTVTGEGRCIFADDGESLVIVADKVYVYNAETDVFGENTNVNLVGTISVTVINSQFIYTTPDFSFMSQPNDPFNVSGLDAIGADSSPDKLVRDYTFNQTIYRFGTKTTEPWYNSGVGSPPIDAIIGQEFSVGLGAINSVAHTDNAIYWLGDDKAVYRVSGGINQRVSDDGISNTIERMETFSDAIGYTFTLQGQDFYLITFPSANRTFVINEKLGLNGWFNLTSGTQGDSYSGTSLQYVYNKNLIRNRGKLLELCLDEYTQDSDTMIRERITDAVNGDDIGMKGQRLKMSRLEIIMEAGVGLITGQGVNPRMLIETSIDGGRTFAHSAWVTIGRLGENTLRVELYQMLSAQEFVFRLSMSDPVPLSIYSAALDIKPMKR